VNALGRLTVPVVSRGLLSASAQQQQNWRFPIADDRDDLFDDTRDRSVLSTRAA